MQDRRVCCPECGSDNIVRYGRRSNRQRYRCRNAQCVTPGGHQFIEDRRDLSIDDKTRRVVHGLLAQGVRPGKIKQAIPEVSLRWIHTQKSRLKTSGD